MGTFIVTFLKYLIGIQVGGELLLALGGLDGDPSGRYLFTILSVVVGLVRGVSEAWKEHKASERPPP